MLRNIDRFVQIERKHSAAIADLQARMVKLEASRDTMIVEARAAASVAASAAASLHVADLARRLGILEERSRPADGPPRIGRS
jgi:hypothetical protein